MMAEPMILTKLRPLWGRVAIVESGVDEEQRLSGLIVPIDKEDDVRRGIVQYVDFHEQDGQGSRDYIGERLVVGAVVYFTGGRKISDLWIVDRDDIIAYEEG